MYPFIHYVTPPALMRDLVETLLYEHCYSEGHVMHCDSPLLLLPPHESSPIPVVSQH